MSSRFYQWRCSGGVRAVACDALVFTYSAASHCFTCRPSCYRVTCSRVSLGSALGSWYEVRKNKRDYKAKVASGAWHEGLFVFPSGDIVVRFNSLLKKQETHIEVSALSKAAVTKRFAMVRGGEVDFLQLHFVDNMGRPMLMEVCGEDLVEDINAIAEHINETKRKGLGGF